MCFLSDTDLDLETDPDFPDDFQSPQINSEYPMYGAAGYHPVHLGDLYDDGLYRIVHKIGAGDTSMIWLARDSLSCIWVALRMMMADQPSSVEENIVKCHSILARHGQYGGDPRFITYTRYFHIDGPNGRHLCLVLPFCGPNLHSLSNYMKSRMKPQFVQALAYQATDILRDLHARGICHGNIRPGNLVLRIRNLDHLDDQGIYRLFGQPMIDELKTESGRVPGLEAPRYVVGFLDFMSSGEDVLLNELCLIDFDHAFEISSPKTPAPLPDFLAPEVAVGKPASPASDVWALGVTTLNMRSGISLFPYHVDCPAHLITECVKYFGELPAPWEEPYYDKEGRPTSDKTKGCPREVSDEIHSLKQWICDIWDEPMQASENESTPAAPFIVRDEDRPLPKSCDWLSDDISPIINYNPQDIDQLSAIHDNTKRPYPKHYANRVWKPSAFKINGTYLPEDGGVGWFTYLPGNSDVEGNLQSLPRISTQEADMLYDLLRKIFVYEGRISAEDILGHPWFGMV
ncbi:CMGC SRPK kinase [Fusarium tjaetaba]|uniref:CMGC SRPK kinase n=1 Tax=Fusarium tjaetaba TaxID=1567544 RepID=A0A8H5W545_9HYPO|nr:CMGC SRPK kinase [Fusarium tjaetaba]KAF5645274.1 CMGC SRPK kinase [Fusarium tjaetaba]